jgi:hypothetical protein
MGQLDSACTAPHRGEGHGDTAQRSPTDADGGARRDGGVDRGCFSRRGVAVQVVHLFEKVNFETSVFHLLGVQWLKRKPGAFSSYGSQLDSNVYSPTLARAGTGAGAGGADFWVMGDGGSGVGSSKENVFTGSGAGSGTRTGSGSRSFAGSGAFGLDLGNQAKGSAFAWGGATASATSIGSGIGMGGTSGTTRVVARGGGVGSGGGTVPLDSASIVSAISCAFDLPAAAVGAEDELPMVCWPCWCCSSIFLGSLSPSLRSMSPVSFCTGFFANSPSGDGGAS